MAPLSDGATMLVNQGQDGTVHIEIRGELDIISVHVLQPEIDAALSYHSSLVVLDAAALTYVDSTGLSVLLRLAARHGALEIRHATAMLRQIIRAAGLADRLRLTTEARLEHREFSPELLAVRESRTFVLDALSDVEASVRELAAVMVAELTTNAVLHAQSSFGVAIQVDDHIVRVEVTDEGAGTPTLLEPDKDAERGRGLRMVDGLAHRWGIRPLGGVASKCVWFELDRPGDGEVRETRPGGPGAPSAR